MSKTQQIQNLKEKLDRGEINRREFLFKLGILGVSGAFAAMITGHATEAEAFFNMNLVKKRSASSSSSSGTSLRFSEATGSVLSRSFTTPTLSTKWTYSVWVKRARFAVAAEYLFGAYSGGGNYDEILFDTSDRLQIYSWAGATYSFQVATNRIFRDPTAWYHIVVSYDSTSGVSNDRLKIWINGVQETSMAVASYPGSGAANFFNRNYTHYIGQYGPGAGTFDANLSENYFIDGQALDASSFGQTDATTGAWNPKTYSGTYGTNGFYLPFNDGANPTTLGYDRQISLTDSSKNNWIANNISFSNDVLLMNMNGTNGSQTFTDSAQSRTFVVHIGSPQVSTTQSKFGGASAYFDGSSIIRTSADNSSTTGFQYTGDFTIEYWVYPTSYSGNQRHIAIQGNVILGTMGGNLRAADAMTINDSSQLALNQWHHVAFVRSGSTGTFYKNGVSIGTATYSGALTATSDMTIGGYSGNSEYFNGYIDDVRITNGMARYTANFTPPTSAFTATTNCVDLMIDSPNNNFAVANPLFRHLGTGYVATYSSANLSVLGSGAGIKGSAPTVAPTSGRWYSEVTISAIGGSTVSVGVCSSANPEQLQISGEFTAAETTNGVQYYSSGTRRSNASSTAGWGNSYTTNDVLSLAFDADTGRVWFGKNGVWQASGDPASGTSPALTLPTVNVPYFFTLAGESGATFLWNFGQGGQSGLTLNTASGGRFKYTPPTGFKALCTANLSTPAVQKPSQFFNVLTYSGTSANQNVTGAGHSPDLVWIKCRNAAENHHLYDTSRGAGTALFSSLSSGENNYGTDFQSGFLSDGFSVGAASGGGINVSGRTYASWLWKKGAAPGFDIVTYNGNGSTNNISHSLGLAPTFVVGKCRGATGRNWTVYHKNMNSTPTSGCLLLNTTHAFISASGIWNSTPSSSTVSLGSDSNLNTSGDPYVMYVWAEVSGFSRFGSYTGNGSSDGPFVWCGFRPAYVLTKRIDGASNWYVWDNKRTINGNGAAGLLYPEVTNVEGSYGAAGIDLLANGFKIRNTDGSNNSSGGSYIFVAFAEMPFKYARAR
jgi:hypothetical protein